MICLLVNCDLTDRKYSQFLLSNMSGWKVDHEWCCVWIYFCEFLSIPVVIRQIHHELHCIMMTSLQI